MYACSELGLGHASRTIALGKRLEQRGHESSFFQAAKHIPAEKRIQERLPRYARGVVRNRRGILTSASLINIMFPMHFYNSETDKF
jgi:hypothetical protein